MHNIAFTVALMARAREAIAAGSMATLRHEVLSIWG
jgi:queuine/archaeosine tRNA-ribosyltransferase